MTDYRAHAFVARKGRVNIFEGDFKPGGIFLCTAGGDLVVTWKDGTTDTIACLRGEPYTFDPDEAEKVTISSGFFHIG